MFEAENIRDWREHDVVDPRGAKVGALEAIYVDTVTDQPAFATVRVGRFGGKRRLVFVPLFGAVVSPRYVKVTYDRALVRRAPAIEPDGELAAGAEPAVFEHYELPYEPGAKGERRLARR